MPNLPVDNPEFWRLRLARAKRQGGSLHPAVYDVSLAEWESINVTHQRILSRVVRPNCRLLDAGCGYGSLLPLLPPSPIDYCGVDLAPSLLVEARRIYPTQSFTQADLRQLPFSDRSFDLCVARSIQGTIIDNLGIAIWRQIEAELLRVADRLLILNYGQPEIYNLVEAVGSQEEFTHNSLHYEGATLVYRSGQDGATELYDLTTSDELRAQPGLAAMNAGFILLNQAISRSEGTVYAFMRASNQPIQKMYQRLGFTLLPLPSFYRGADAVMAYKPYDQS